MTRHLVQCRNQWRYDSCRQLCRCNRNTRARFDVCVHQTKQWLGRQFARNSLLRTRRSPMSLVTRLRLRMALSSSARRTRPSATIPRKVPRMFSKICHVASQPSVQQSRLREIRRKNIPRSVEKIREPNSLADFLLRLYLVHHAALLSVPRNRDVIIRAIHETDGIIEVGNDRCCMQVSSCRARPILHCLRQMMRLDVFALG